MKLEFKWENKSINLECNTMKQDIDNMKRMWVLAISECNNENISTLHSIDINGNIMYYEEYIKEFNKGYLEIKI